jgi:hypothetical protein
VGLPKLTLMTVFEVVKAGKIYRVAGSALQRWIVDRHQFWNGPKGYLFAKRPGLGIGGRFPAEHLGTARWSPASSRMMFR